MAGLIRVLVVAGALLAAGLAPASAQPRTTLRISTFGQDVGSLDPHYAVGSQDRVPVSWMFNALVRFKPGSANPADLEPDLAESWESSPDKRSWTFHLRRGVQFHAGYGELTADDVVFSIQKAADAKTSAFSADYAAIDRVEAVDAYTVRIGLKQTVPSLLGLLTNYSGGFIVSKRAMTERAAGFGRAPVGTGPFAFESVAPNQSLELVAHDAYFRGKPRLRRLSLRYMPSIASRDLAFQTGELDVTNGMQDQTWVNRIRTVPHVVVDVLEPSELSALYLNTTRKPLDDLRVRQAIAYAVNRQELVRWRGADVSREPQSVIPRGYLGFAAQPELPRTDIEKAKRLLAEAGYPNGLTIPVVQSQNPDMMSAMQVVQAQLKRAGIMLDLQLVEHATFHQMIRQDQSPIVFYAAARFPIADPYLTQFYHSRSTVKAPGAVTNFSHCNAADAEIDAARSEPEPERQLALWNEAQQKITAAVCGIPLIETLQAWAHRDDFDYGFEQKGAMATGPLITEQSHFK